MKTFIIHNFGCKVNQEEGAAIAALFAGEGWEQLSGKDAAADLIIINTCTVTATADKKSRNLIRRLRRQNPEAILAVCGCYAQRAAAEIAALGGVDIIAGVEERRQLPRLVAEYAAQKEGGSIVSVAPIKEAAVFRRIAADSAQTRARAYLKIEDGCDQFCHYCIIPYVRGPVRSLPLAQAVAQAEKLLAAGHRELVLSGIHVGAYGRDLPEGEDLPTLLRALLALPGLGRLRLGSVEPQQFTAELISLIGSEKKICPHLHIPLQSGADRTLRAMGRRYDTAFYRALLERLLVERPELAFTTDIIAGYPGETEEDHQTALAFLESLPLSAAHVFPYSRRSGTVAYGLPRQVDNATKERRAGELAAAARAKHLSFGGSFCGRELDMLGEEIAVTDGRRWLRGRAGNYLTLLLPWEEEEPLREIFPVTGVRMTNGGLIVRLAR
ncbi:MAG: tRNA (N(6)-L-threonylcarbamoyladenosine(37)-C(2))-methylthiotransferase MtaB [Firmicutes bacterium]|nr:tRNA (N(6)-L-threonylcarbamoyladenosine(37)-C(2))-methylthiotransferase MtaB [Bacillota bacterium]